MSKFWTNIKEKLNAVKFKFGKKSQMALAGVLALIMLIIFFKGLNSSGEQPEKLVESSAPTISTEDYITQLESRLEAVVSSIKGVGEVEVFLMAETSVEAIYATNTETDTNGDGENKASSEIVLSKDGTKTMPVVRLEIYPKIVGALVVIEGGGDEKLRLMVLNAVSVALELENSKIEVLEGKSQ